MSKDKQSIQVTIRVRPLSEKEKQEDNRICVDVEEQTHSIQTFYGNENKKFTFDSICNNNTQEDLFEKVGKKSTVYCLDGYNCTIFAYGQTGSGKTFTMMGVDPAHQQYDQLRGLIPRTLEYLFESIDLEIKQTSSEYIIRCSFLEIYNEQIIDLLNPKNNSNLQIREDIKKGVYVEGISEETIFKGDEALDILKKGSKGRHVGSTCYNETSSRSHSVFTMQIESKHTKNGVVNTKVRHFHFIDLAGSERTKQINGDRLKEGCSINKSLHVLGKVINSLAESTESKPRHINYRDSKLTFLLKDSLGGNSKTHLIANISPCAMSYSESNMTLAFARRVKLIKVNKALINEDMSGNLQSLKTQIKRLKQEIILLKNNYAQNGTAPQFDGNQSLNQSSILSPAKGNQQDTRMISMLNQYVSEELDKQTKFQLEINKLYKKLECLQNGIKKYSENQIHFKMIIAVYEDKVNRMKKAESLLSVKIDELNSESDESSKIVDYFKQEREELLKETANYKKITSENSNILLKLLKSCKAYHGESSKQNQSKEEFLNLLKNNTEFLNQLYQSIKEIKQETGNSHENNQTKPMDQVIEQKLALMDLQYSKKQTQLLQRIEQLHLQINQFKTLNEDNEVLLKESVNREITLEGEVKEKQKKVAQLEQMVAANQQKLLLQAQEGLKSEKKISEKNEENSKLKKELKSKQDQIKQLIQKEKNNLKSKKQLQETLTKSTAQNELLKQRISQVQNELVDSIKDYEKKLFHLDQKFKQNEEKYAQFEQSVINLKSQIQQKDNSLKQLISNSKKETEEMNNFTTQLEHKLLKQQKEILSLNELKIKADQKSKTLQQKITVLTQQLESKQDQIQKLSLSLIHSKHESQEKSTKIQHLDSLVKQKQVEQQSYIAKFKTKEDELLQMINDLQNSTESSNEEFNKIRIESIHLKQSNSELQLKVSKLSQQLKELQLSISVKNLKVHEIKCELQEKEKKIFTEKEELTKKKEEIRELVYQMEELKSQVTKHQTLISKKDEEFEEVHSRNIQIMEEMNQMKQQVNSKKLQLKEFETKLFCLQKSSQIEKDALLKENERKLSKLNDQIMQKTSQVKKYQKILSEQRLKMESFECEIRGLNELNAKNQQIFKQSLQKELSNKSLQTTELKQKISLLEEQSKESKEALEVKIKELEAQNLKKRNEIEKSTIQYEKNEQQIAHLNSIVAQKETLLKQLQQSIEEMKIRHESELEELQFEHNQQIDRKNQEIDSMDEQIKTKTQQIIEKQQEIQSKDKELNLKMEEIQSKNGLIESLRQQIANKNHLIQVQQSELKDKGQEIQTEIEQINEKKDNITKLSQQLQKALIQLDRLNIQYNTKKEQISNLTSHVTNLTQQTKNLNSSIQTKTTQCNQLNQTCHQLQSTISEIESKKQILESTVSELKQKNTELEQKYTELESKSAELDSKNSQLELEVTELKSNNSQLEQKNIKLESELQEASQTIQDMKSELVSKDDIIAKNQQKKDEKDNDMTQKLNNIILKKENQVNIIKEQCQELNQKMRILISQNQKVRSQLFQSRQEIEQLQESKTLLNSKCVSLENQNKQISTRLQLFTSKFEDSSNSIVQRQEIISELNAQLQELQNSSSDQKSTISLLNKKLQEQMSLNQEKQEELRQLTGQNQKLRFEIDNNSKDKLILQAKYEQVCSHNGELQLSIQELSQQINQINCNYEQIQSDYKQLLSEKESLSLQVKQVKDSFEQTVYSEKNSYRQQISELQQTIKSQKSRIEQLQMQVKQKESNLSTLSEVNGQKEELMESYKSLQQINKGLGRKCEELLSTIQEQKTQYRKLQTKYLGEKNINQNLKQLIQNSQQQKKHLSVQLKEKNEIYQKLLEKISKNESLHGEKEKKSEHYLKTVDLLEKSRHQQLELRKNSEELKRQLLQKSQLLEKKEFQMKQLTRKSEDYSRTIQARVKQFEADYLQLERKYEQLLQNKKSHQKAEQENITLKQQLQETRPKISRLTLKIQELQERIRLTNQDYIDLQNENHDLKKRILYPGTTDEKASMYINKLKSEINDLKKEKHILEDTVKKETSEKMKLKTEMLKNSPQSTTDTQQYEHTRQQLDKRLTEIRYLQEIIAEMIDILKIKQFQQGINPKSIKIESIRKGIVTSIKEKIQQNKYLREKIQQLESRQNLKEKENKSISSIVYNGVGSGSSKKQTNTASNQKLQRGERAERGERREKSFSMKEEQFTYLMKNKLSSISGSGLSQQKRERKGIHMGEGLRPLQNEESAQNGREKMKVKQIITNTGKFYKNLQ